MQKSKIRDGDALQNQQFLDKSAMVTPFKMNMFGKKRDGDALIDHWSMIDDDRHGGRTLFCLPNIAELHTLVITMCLVGGIGRKASNIIIYI